jgi:alanine racemase
MTLVSRIVAVKECQWAEGVGYGVRFRPATELDSRVPRVCRRPRSPAGGRGAVLIRGRRAPIVGAVSMDMMSVDVTGLEVAPGDEVVILGQGGDRSTSARWPRDRHDSVRSSAGRDSHSGSTCAFKSGQWSLVLIIGRFSPSGLTVEFQFPNQFPSMT